MADKTTKLQHINGGAVTVSADKADRLVAGGSFTKAATTSSRKSSNSDDK